MPASYLLSWISKDGRHAALVAGSGDKQVVVVDARDFYRPEAAGPPVRRCGASAGARRVRLPERCVGKGGGVFLGMSAQSFFLQAIIGDDPLDTALADRELGLAQLLGDDRGGGLWVQKAVAQDLPHGWVGAAVIGFGPVFCGWRASKPPALKACRS